MESLREKKKRYSRYLGDAWREWDGDLSRYEWDVDTSRNTYLLLFALFWIAAVGMVWLLWYLIVPRLAQFHPKAPALTGVVFLAVGLLLVLVSLSVILSVLTNRRLFFTRFALFMVILAFHPMARLAQRFGFSQDRAGNSFLKIHNTLTCLLARGAGYDRILVLLPRCLAKDARLKLVAIAEKYKCRLYTAGGGTEALNHVRAMRPRAVVAVACERDLFAGIRDAGTAIPVIGIPNIRENGPCWKAGVDYEKFEKAVSYFSGEHAPVPQDDAVPAAHS